jgi:hypothetical protein
VEARLRALHLFVEPVVHGGFLSLVDEPLRPGTVLRLAVSWHFIIMSQYSLNCWMQHEWQGV